MNDKKIIIRNCPCFIGGIAIKGKEQKTQTCNNHKIRELTLCQDCTDCKLKQIVELCKAENTEGENLASIMRLSDKHTKEFLSRFASNKILELLDIEEVE